MLFFLRWSWDIVTLCSKALLFFALAIGCERGLYIRCAREEQVKAMALENQAGNR